MLATTLGLGIPAWADTVPQPAIDNAYLTKVINAPLDMDLSKDTYVFKFTGNGTVDAKYTSGGVLQDKNTIKEGDEIPAIGDVTLSGVKLTKDNSQGNGTFRQTVVRKSMKDILKNVTFPHAGIYTYKVSEQDDKTSAGDAVTRNNSKAEYYVHVDVKVVNGKATPTNVTIEKTNNDEGTDPKTGGSGNKGTGTQSGGNQGGDGQGGSGTGDGTAAKVDPSYPHIDDKGSADPHDPNHGQNGIISDDTDGNGGGGNDPDGDGTKTSTDETAPSGNDRGLDVPGFTFGNEYVKSVKLTTEKLVEGDYGDYTKLFPVTLKLTDTAASDGWIVTYETTGDAQDTNNNTYNKEKCVSFSNHVATINTVKLTHQDTIVITGVYGPEANGTRTAIATNGLKQGTTYALSEADPSADGYAARGFNYNQTDRPTTVPTKDTTNPAPVPVDSTATTKVMNLTATVGANGAYGIVLNSFDDADKVSPTGIFIDNLPYVLMIGIPVAVGVALFVNKRHQSDELA